MNKKVLGIVILIFVISALFSYYRLGSSVLNVDGQLWYARTSAFIKAAEKHKFQNTYQDPKPGVPLMWLSGISSELFFRVYESRFGFRPDFFVKDSFPLIFTAFVLPLVLVNLLSGVFFFFLVKKLTNIKIALLSYVLFAFHPYYLGISRFLHVDSLMTNFIVLSYLLFLIYVKEKKIINLLGSGFLFGSALLTKSQAFFLLPIMFVSVCLYEVFLPNIKPLSIFILVKKIVTPLLVIALVASATYYIFFPAMWSKPIKTLNKVYGEAVYVAETGRSIKNVRPFFHYVYVLPRILSFSLVVMYFGSIVYLFYKRKEIKREDLVIYTQLSLFVIIYFLEISVVKQKIDRYLLPMFPFIFISCAVFWSYLKNFKLIFITLFATLLFTLLYYAPHYAMFGCNDQECNTHGFLYKEVGDYIDKNTTQKFPTVVAMTKSYSLKVFVDGNTYGYEDVVPDNINVDFLVTNDYFIKDRGIPKKLSHCVFWHRIYFHGIPEWDIYKCR